MWKKIMENQRKTAFLGGNVNRLYRREQEYLRNLIRSLFQLQNSGPLSAEERDRHGSAAFHDGKSWDKERVERKKG
jgi:hypothetical protein